MSTGYVLLSGFMACVTRPRWAVPKSKRFYRGWPARVRYLRQRTSRRSPLGCIWLPRRLAPALRDQLACPSVMALDKNRDAAESVAMRFRHAWRLSRNTLRYFRATVSFPDSSNGRAIVLS